jgi:CheY-like chemotaxis protein
MVLLQKPITVLFADDDPDDRLLLKQAFESAELMNDLRCVKDGEELLDYLYLRSGYKEGNAPRPNLILLDFNMPRKNGREVLKEIKADPDLKQIPLVILSTSKHDEDILYSYRTGANSYLTKPVTFTGLVQMVKRLITYWQEVVRLPPPM